MLVFPCPVSARLASDNQWIDWMLWSIVARSSCCQGPRLACIYATVCEVRYVRTYVLCCTRLRVKKRPRIGRVILVFMLDMFLGACIVNNWHTNIILPDKLTKRPNGDYRLWLSQKSNVLNEQTTNWNNTCTDDGSIAWIYINGRIESTSCTHNLSISSSFYWWH